MRLRKLQRSALDFVVRSFPSLGLDRRAESFVRCFEDKLPERSSILDVGGGWGFYAGPVKKRGHSLTVLDVVRPGVQKAPVVLYEGGRFPFADKSFDVVFLITVLHHIADPEKVIREAHRVTRRLVVLVEDLYHHATGRWWTVLRDQIFNFEFFGHPKMFKKREEWLKVFRQEGFSLVEEQALRTRLAGFGILNGIFLFKP